MNPISKLEEWSRTRNVMLSYDKPMRTAGSPDHAARWTVCLTVTVAVEEAKKKTLFTGKSCSKAQESKADAAAQAVAKLVDKQDKAEVKSSIKQEELEEDKSSSWQQQVTNCIFGNWFECDPPKPTRLSDLREHLKKRNMDVPEKAVLNGYLYKSDAFENINRGATPPLWRPKVAKE